MSDSWQPTPEQPVGGAQPAPSSPLPAHVPQQFTGWTPPPPAPKPGVIPLRPLGVAELLDGAITTIRRYPKAILLPSFVVALALGLIGFVVQMASLSFLTGLSDLEGDINSGTVSGSDVAALVGPTLALSLIAVLVQFIATVLLTGVVTVVMSQAVLGRDITVSQAWLRLRPQAWRLIGLSLLITLMCIGVTVAATLMVLVLGILTAGIGLLLFLVVWVPPLALLTYVAIAPAALLLERSGVGTSISRAWSLTSGAFWRTLGTLVLMGIIYTVISVGVSLPFSAPEFIAPSIDSSTGDVNETRYIINSAIATVGSVIVSTIALPFVAGVISLLYIDRRMRKEGLDITLARSLQQ